MPSADQNNEHIRVSYLGEGCCRHPSNGDYAEMFSFYLNSSLTEKLCVPLTGERFIGLSTLDLAPLKG